VNAITSILGRELEIENQQAGHQQATLAGPLTKA